MKTSNLQGNKLYYILAHQINNYCFENIKKKKSLSFSRHYVCFIHQILSKQLRRQKKKKRRPKWRMSPVFTFLQNGGGLL